MTGDEQSLASSGDARSLVPARSVMNVPSQSSNKTTWSMATVGCASTALVISFLGLTQFDLPIIRYVRSVTIHLPWDQLIVPWMAFTSNAGDWIGQGWRLASLSILLLAVGWVFKKPTLTAVAIQSLIAHGIAALLANGLKHLIGRPRPKFVHSGDWQMSLSWTSGLDSFPSGHTTASFAVATVLARRFPLVGPLCIAVAFFVGVSRIFRGSHFPTDVVGGAVIGILSGSLATAPLGQWRTSLQDGLRDAALGVSGVFALLWALSRQMDTGILSTLFMALGIAAVMGGLWIRTTYWTRREGIRGNWHSSTSMVLIVYGLAALTTSPLVLSSVGFACMASWLDAVRRSEEHGEEVVGWPTLQEIVFLGGLLFAGLILIGARGVLPFQ